MSDQLKEVRIFIASPSDVENERMQAVKIIEELNSTGVARSMGLILHPITFSDVISKIGERPEQAILDYIDMEDLDIFVGIMWKRFGTPTGAEYESGTEEEFHVAYDRFSINGKPRILFYFNMQMDRMPSSGDFHGMQKVMGLKEKIGNLGLYTEYSGISEFEKKFRRDITRVILNWEQKIKTCVIDIKKTECNYFETWRDAYSTDRISGERVEAYLYKKASNNVRFMTISGRSVFSNDVEEALKSKNMGSFRFELLLFDWNSPFFATKMNDERRESGVEIEMAKKKACAIAENFLSMGKSFGIDLEIRLYTQYPVWRCMIIDNETAFLGYYPTGKRGYEGPMHVYKKDEEGSLFYPVNQYFEKLWEVSGPSLVPGDSRFVISTKN